MPDLHDLHNLQSLPTGTVTFLFTDMEGSTRLLQQVGKRYADVLADCRRLMRAEFARHDGHEMDTQGDAFFVVFDRATDAVGAAISVQQALADAPWPEDVEVRVRVGLHTGEPILTSDGYIGLDIHLAARIMSAGHGGQILLSQTTRDLVEQHLTEGAYLRDLGEHRLKDVHKPVHLFQVCVSGFPADFPPLNTLNSRPNNLPAQPTPFIGREQEVASIVQLLSREDVRLLTLTGPGGTGKSRLSLQVAMDMSNVFPDGVVFVNLTPIADSALVIPTIARTLDLKETGDQSLLALLKASLREKKLLLLLDNFERVVSAATQLADLLAACPKLKIVVTSRVVLHVRAEYEFAVPSLALPDLQHPQYTHDLAALAQYEAVALFIQRAQAVRPDFQITEANAPAIVEVCARVDGLPLAIELAAARMKLLTPQALLARLSQRLQVLTSTAKDIPARQQTLRNTIEWSYTLLDNFEQQIFYRLAVFVGGCTVEAVEALYARLDDETEQVLDGVSSLADKSLLRQAAYGKDGEETRLVMLETIREYARERLAASGEKERARQAHAEYYLALVEEAEPELSGPQQVAWFERLEREHDNLRTAIQWFLEPQSSDHQRVEMALRLVGALQRYWRMSGHFSEGKNYLELALTRSQSTGQEAGQQPNPALRAKALNVAADVALFDLYEHERAEALCQESLALYRELGDIRGIATSLSLLGWVAQRRFHREAASALHEESLALSRKLGDRRAIAEALYDLSYLAFSQGDYERSNALKEESLALFRELGDKWRIAFLLLQVVSVASYAGDYEKACPLAEEGLRLFRELEDKEGTADALLALGGVTLNEGDYVRAEAALVEGLGMYRELGLKRGIAKSLFALGRVAFGQTYYAKAQALHTEGLTLFTELDDKWLIALALEELAAAVAMQGQAIWAAHLVGAAAAYRESIGSTPLPAERTNYQHALVHARNQASEQRFEAAVEEGRAMTPEQALGARE